MTQNSKITKKCKIHDNPDYNCRDCVCDIMGGMEEVNRKYKPNFNFKHE